jgi:hypothetical protein
MITVGLVKELYFISKVFNTKLDATITLDGNPLPLKIEISNNILDVWYKYYHIWREAV